MAMKISTKRPQIIEMHLQGVQQSKIAEELGYSASLVSQCVLDYKVLNAKKRRDECQRRQQSLDDSVRKKCTDHETCSTCDCRRKKRGE